MRDDFDVDDELTRRLRALGQFPVDSASQSRHLTQMAEAAAAPTLLGTLAGRVRLAAALIVGFMLGTTGLASAGALGPLQPIAKKTIEAVTPLSVPEGHAGTERYKGAECAAVPADEYRNHGQYVKAVRKAGGDVKAAAQSRCGKPLNAGDEEDSNESKKSEQSDELDTNDADEPKGKSEDKGNKGGNSDEAKQNGAAKQEDSQGAENSKAEALCASGADNGVDPATVADDPGTAPTPATAQPDCAADQKDAGGPPEGAGQPESTEAGDDDEDADVTASAEGTSGS